MKCREIKGQGQMTMIEILTIIGNDLACSSDTTRRCSPLKKENRMLIIKAYVADWTSPTFIPDS